MEEKQTIDLLEEQIKLLTEWNKASINIEPEQVRKNIETILSVANYLHSFKRTITL